MSSSSRSRKRARAAIHGPSDVQLELAEFASTRCSHPALVRACKILSRKPELIGKLQTTSALEDATDAFASHLCDTIHLPIVDATPFEWWIGDIRVYLAFFTRRSYNFRSLLKAACARHGAGTETSPLTLILYSDEATPGAVMRQENKRKSHCFYFSVLEFGAHALVHEAAWLPLGYLRSQIASTVVGGLSAVLVHLMRYMLLGERSIVSVGVVVDELADDGSALLLFFKQGPFIVDESALNSALSTKGATGLFPCAKCDNVYGRLHEQEEHDLGDHDTSNELVDLSCNDPALAT